ncbi:helix-turn-helix transcriptional regulator [Escherichia coli]
MATMTTLEHKHSSDTPLSINVNNVLAYKHLLIFLDQCDMNMCVDGEMLFFEKGTIVSIERGLKYSCNFKKHYLEGPPFRYIAIDQYTIKLLKDILILLYDYKLNESSLERKITDKVIGVWGDESVIRIFNLIANSLDNTRKAIKIAYMLSKSEHINKLVHSINISAAKTFTDKVRSIIEKDLSKKWRLNKIADEFNISEITVRKRLESENTSFHNVLMDLRMNRAIHLLHENEKQIHQISRLIGISSPSYFIKLFKDYYGVTPKQYIIYFRS